MVGPLKPKNFLTKTKRFIQDHYQILIISFLIACNSIPAYTLDYSPGIDGPLPWVYNYFADGHFDKCLNLQFPHGPLAFLLYPLMVGNNVLVCVVLTFICSFLLSLNLFLLVKNPQDRIVSTISILFLQTFLSIQTLLALLTLSYVLLFHLKRNAWLYVPAVFFAILNLFIKSYGGVICFFILFADWLLLLFRKDFKVLWVVPMTGLLAYFIFRLSLFGTFDHSIDFLRAQLELSDGNSGAVSFFQANDWRFISLFIYFFFLFPFVVRDLSARHLWLIMVLPVFAAWKHGMSRADHPHIDGFLSFIIVFYLLAWILSSGNKVRILIMGALTCGAFIINLGNYATYNDYAEEKTAAVIKPYNLYKLIFRYDSLRKARTNDIAAAHEKTRLPDTLLRLIGKQSVDIWPWNYSLIVTNQLNWVPRPTLHTYAMYSPWLDRQNAAHIASDQSARYILWEIKELGGRYRSADGRYLLNDGPAVTEKLISGFQLVYKDDRYFLYEKKQKPEDLLIATKGEEVKYKFSDWIEIPRVDSHEVLRAKINLSNNLKGAFKSFLFKGEGFHIVLELENGESAGMKIVPGNSAQGVWIYPLIFEPGLITPEPQARRMKVFCTDTNMVKNEIVVQFETINFKNNYDLKRNFFGK